MEGSFLGKDPECGFGDGVLGEVLEFDQFLDPGAYELRIEYEYYGFEVASDPPPPTPVDSFEVRGLIIDSPDCEGENRPLGIELSGTSTAGDNVRRFGWSTEPFRHVPSGSYVFGPVHGGFGIGCWTSQPFDVTDGDTEVRACGCTRTPTRAPTPTRHGRLCVGDCNGDGRTAIHEILQCVNAAINGQLRTCESCLCDDRKTPGINCLVAAVISALEGCEPPTPSGTATVTPTPEASSPTPRPTTLECTEPERPHDTCGDLLTLGLSCAYDGIRYSGGGEQATTAYLRSGPYLYLESWLYYARESATHSRSYEGGFDVRFCAGDFPKPFDGEIHLSEDLSEIEFIQYGPSGELIQRFQGNRRAPR